MMVSMRSEVRSQRLGVRDQKSEVEETSDLLPLTSDPSFIRIHEPPPQPLRRSGRQRSAAAQSLAAQAPAYKSPGPSNIASEICNPKESPSDWAPCRE